MANIMDAIQRFLICRLLVFQCHSIFQIRRFVTLAGTSFRATAISTSHTGGHGKQRKESVACRVVTSPASCPMKSSSLLIVSLWMLLPKQTSSHYCSILIGPEQTINSFTSQIFQYCIEWCRWRVFVGQTRSENHLDSLSLSQKKQTLGHQQRFLIVLRDNLHNCLWFLKPKCNW